MKQENYFPLIIFAVILAAGMIFTGWLAIREPMQHIHKLEAEQRAEEERKKSEPSTHTVSNSTSNISEPDGDSSSSSEPKTTVPPTTKTQTSNPEPTPAPTPAPALKQEPEKTTPSGLTRSTALDKCIARAENDWTGDLNAIDAERIAGDSWYFEIEYLIDTAKYGFYYLGIANCTVSGSETAPKITNYSSDIYTGYREYEDGHYEEDMDYEY